MRTAPKIASAITRLCALVAGCLVLAAVAASPALAQYEIPAGKFTVDMTDDQGDPVTQAGSHPSLATTFQFPTRPIPGDMVVPAGTIRDVYVDLPGGLLGNPRDLPTCTQAQLTQGGEPFSSPQCPPESQVGTLELFRGPCATSLGCTTGELPLFNMERGDDAPASFGVNVGGLATVTLKARVMNVDGRYVVRIAAEKISEVFPWLAMRAVFFGVPADRNGSGADRVPFIRNATSCAGPRDVQIRVASWQDPETVSGPTPATLPAATGCEKLTFAPTLDLRPRETQRDAPAGYDVTVKVPQTSGADELATPDLRKAVVRLPEGVSISPPSADGLVACSDDRLRLTSDGEPDCPLASRLGSVSIVTPLLDDPLEGHIVLRDPKPGQLFRLALVASGQGVVLKLPGDVLPDARTGRLTTVFENTPELPFTELRLSFKGGSRAPLANPQTCGAKTTTSELTPYSGAAAATPESSFEVTGCGAPSFGPTFAAGTINPFAGAFSPFTMTIRRADGDQDLASLALDLPPGLLGTVRGVPQCPEAQVAAGACGAETQVGRTVVEAGAGEHPFGLPGKVFFAGPYKGAPFSLAVVVRAIAGPFDLGTVVVRAPINVDAANAKLGVPSDPLPTILEGVPLRLRTVNITIDRPNFMFNATNCTPGSIQARIVGTGGAVAQRGVPYSATGCANLPLRPQLELTMRGAKEVKDGSHPGLDASMTQAPGEAGLKRVSVKLPLSLALEPENAQALCKPGEAAAKACPAGSIVGRATAVTSALNQPLSGPLYFVENTRTTASGAVRRTLPKLWLALRGEVPLDLYAESTVVDDHLVATFDLIPDAPISSFALSIAGGENGILAATQSICAKPQIASVTFDGQNGKRLSRELVMGSECGYRVAAAQRNKTSITLTVSGLGAGRLELSGKGLVTSRRTLKRATIARATAKLSTASRRTLRRKGRLSTRVSVKFAPAGGGKPRTTGMKVTFRR